MPALQPHARRGVTAKESRLRPCVTQLFIQGFYLITSGDTGNVVVLVSVSVSGCSLLLRFVRGAFAFIASAGESKLAETSPMRNWDTGRLNEWLAGVAAEVPALAVYAQRTQRLPPKDLLCFVDYIISAQAGLLREAEEEAEERDRNKFTKSDVASSGIEVLGAGV